MTIEKLATWPFIKFFRIKGGFYLFIMSHKENTNTMSTRLAFARLESTQSTPTQTRKEKTMQPLKVMSKRTQAYNNNHQHQPPPMASSELCEKCFNNNASKKGTTYKCRCRPIHSWRLYLEKNSPQE